MLVIVTLPISISADPINEFEKRDLPFDTALDIRVTLKNNRTIPIHKHHGILPRFLFGNIDIISFSLYEKNDDPDHLYANMILNKFKFSEYRTCYAIYFTFNDIRYYIATNTHSRGEAIGEICGYFTNNGGVIYQIDGEIIKDENKITWKVPREYVGYVSSGDTLEELFAASYLIYQKDCQADYKLNIASDIVKPLFGDGYSYTLQL
jgi:hypothetical protein